jgi:hypothetical protein
MDLLTIVIILIAVGILLFIINRIPFIDAGVKTILYWVVIGVVVIWLLAPLGVFHYIGNVHIGRFRN